MKVKILVIILFLLFVLCICIWSGMSSSGNNKLIFNEIIAYFRPTIYLNFCPTDMISEIQIGGAISMHSYDLMKYGNATYNQVSSMDQITNYLNTLKLVEAKEDELPNKSPDAFVQYFGRNGNLYQNFTIYGGDL